MVNSMGNRELLLVIGVYSQRGLISPVAAKSICKLHCWIATFRAPATVGGLPTTIPWACEREVATVRRLRL